MYDSTRSQKLVCSSREIGFPSDSFEGDSAGLVSGGLDCSEVMLIDSSRIGPRILNYQP